MTTIVHFWHLLQIPTIPAKNFGFFFRKKRIEIVPKVEESEWSYEADLGLKVSFPKQLSNGDLLGILIPFPNTLFSPFHDSLTKLEWLGDWNCEERRGWWAVLRILSLLEIILVRKWVHSSSIPNVHFNVHPKMLGKLLEPWDEEKSLTQQSPFSILGFYPPLSSLLHNQWETFREFTFGRSGTFGAEKGENLSYDLSTPTQTEELRLYESRLFPFRLPPH